MSRIQHGEARISAKILGPQVMLSETEDARNANFDAAKAYMNSIGGGTDQIQKNIIAERDLGLPKSLDVSRDIPFKVTCAPTSYHFLVESFDCFGLKRPSVASVDFGRIHAV